MCEHRYKSIIIVKQLRIKNKHTEKTWKRTEQEYTRCAVSIQTGGETYYTVRVNSIFSIHALTIFQNVIATANATKNPIDSTRSETFQCCLYCKKYLRQF